MKNKIIEKLKSDKDLLYRTLRNELIDGSPFYRFIVFEDIDEDAKEVLEYNYPDFKTLLEERENKSCVGYYIFNEETKSLTDIIKHFFRGEREQECSFFFLKVKRSRNFLH